MENEKHLTNAMSEETFDFVCTACDGNGKTVEAVRYCIECSSYYCQTCTGMHSTFPILKDHNLLDACQRNQASNQLSSLPEFATERCSLHKGKVVDIYCEDHDEVCCCTCIAMNHTSCTIFSIPDTIDTLFKRQESQSVIDRLKDTISFITTQEQSRDAKLDALKEARDKEIAKLHQFKSVLMSIIKRATASSKYDIESKYIEMVKEIREEKESICNMKQNIRDLKTKSKKADGNRAQRFVCNKLVEKQMKETYELLSKNEENSVIRDHLLFTPNNSLMDYMNALQSIGEAERIRTELYKVKESKDINIKMTDDFEMCSSLCCCLTLDFQLLVSEYSKRKLKRIDTQTLTVVDYCSLDCPPRAICCINDYEAAVACENKKIQFVSIDKKMKPSRQVKVSHDCYGISSRNDMIFVTDNASNVFIYDMCCCMLKTVSHDDFGIELFTNSRHVSISEYGDKMYVSDMINGIICLDGLGNYLSNFDESDLKGTEGVCVDGKSNLFAVEWKTNNVVQFNKEGEKIGVVVKKKDGLKNPYSICFDKKLKRLFVTMMHSDVVKMYELS